VVLLIDSYHYKSLALFIYEELGWDSVDYIRPSQLGWYIIKDGQTTAFSASVSNLGQAYVMKLGNTGEFIIETPGKHVFITGYC
jgi:hypothetical protein